MHKLYDSIVPRVSIPLFHIADTLGHALAADGLTRAGLLGTRTPWSRILRPGSAAGFIEVIVPDEDIETIHTIIFDELCRGIIRDGSRDAYLEIMDDLASRGAEGIVLGCTEIEMLVKPQHHALPFTTRRSCMPVTPWNGAFGRVTISMVAGRGCASVHLQLASPALSDFLKLPECECWLPPS